jgi:hypothetical protein
MPYTTVVAGDVITASWSNTNNRDQVVTPFATIDARGAIATPVEGMVTYIAADKTLWIYNGTVWKPIAGPPVAYKTSNETVYNSDTLQDDDDLAIAVDENAYYRGELWIEFTSDVSAGLDVDFTAPLGSTIDASSFLVVVSGTLTFTTTNPLGAVGGIVSGGDPEPYMHKFTLKTGGATGTLQFRWCQSLPDTSNTTVNAGSYLKLERIG